MSTNESTDRVTISLPVSLTRAVEEFWHAHKLGSRSEAFRSLIERGLKAEARTSGAERKKQ
jgi:metal-responsive CopG/Arc/MetJ family transcriptional regulator